MNEKVSATTPLMAQYFAIKNQYPDTLLLFQVGDFYELFLEDAQKAAAFLGIALTKRGSHKGEPIPLCGVPLHAQEFYVAKLVRGGFKVALCEQLEDPKPGKVVDRGVTQVLTPGTLTEMPLLDEKSASYLCVVFAWHTTCTLLWCELLTGQLALTHSAYPDTSNLESELARFSPDEVLVPTTKYGKELEQIIKKLGYFTTLESFEPHSLDIETNVNNWVKQQFNTEWYDAVKQHEGVRGVLTLLYTYLKRTQETALKQFKHIQQYTSEEFLVLDAVTQRNIELIKNNFDGTTAHTLFALLDQAVTGMGSRTIKKWLARPLAKQESIEQRLDAVEELVKTLRLRSHIRAALKEIGDIERVIGRIALKRAQLHDYILLKNALTVFPTIKHNLAGGHAYLLELINAKIGDFSPLVQFLDNALNTDTHSTYCIKPGFDAQLDRLRDLAQNGTQAIALLEREEQQKTGISSLKIRYSTVYGYFIEITKANYHLVPARFIRVQTLVGRERFTTPELKDLERQLTTAHNEISTLEKAIFDLIKQEVEKHLTSLQKAAQALAYVDALAAFAEVAYTRNYIRPTFNTQRDICITEGRHPVIESIISQPFIANSTTLVDQESLWVITGPNMGGKSTYLRQVALICIMAHCGSFVSAQAASIPLLDRIFTRIGASDKVAEGKSTFLVEMEETALICRYATKKSLVILDEVGRGTSTFDGIALAQAVLEYIHSTIGARCLFATHYHELTLLEATRSGVVNYHAACSKRDNNLLFLHKIIRGIAEGSFGLEVARLAQLPDNIITRAQEILRTLA